MEKQYKTFTVERKAIDPEAGIYEAMISTENPDRDGDVILASGGDFGNFLKNPVVLYAHNYWDLPVAKALEVEKLSGLGVRARFQFPEWNESENADTVRRLWAGGFLNATSIGFIPKKWEPRKTPEGEALERGYLITEWELLEFSIVPVPANQDALRLAVKAMTPVVVEKSFKGGREELEIIDKRGRVLSAANERKIRSAVDSLTAVLESLGEQEDEDGKGIDELTKTVLYYEKLAAEDQPEGKVRVELKCVDCGQKYQMSATLMLELLTGDTPETAIRCADCRGNPESMLQAPEPETVEPTEDETAEPTTNDTEGDASEAEDVEVLAEPIHNLIAQLRRAFGGAQENPS